jgi:F-type H+-transporting ATPase subunit epsilon
MPLTLTVVTPTSEAASMTVDEVVVPGSVGELGLLPGHVPLISALKPGVMTMIKDGRRSYAVVSTGFVEIDNDVVTVLTESFEQPSQIDVERARKALADAEEKLKTLGSDEPGYVEARRRAQRAQARIDGASIASN